MREVEISQDLCGLCPNSSSLMRKVEGKGVERLKEKKEG